MADEKLAGKVALVTGSSRGLGRHYALQLAAAGADVVIHDVDDLAASAFGEAPSGYAVAEEVRAFSRRSDFFPADLTDPDQVKKLADQMMAAFGRIDILVNNAGGDIGASTPRPIPNNCLDIHDEDIKAVVERNLLTTMYTCKYFGTNMRAQGFGRIINVGSAAGHLPVQEGIVYAAAKAGISHYTRCLAEELRPYAINVNCIAPTATYTGRFLATRTVDSEEGKSRLQRVARPEEMANIVLFLAGPESDRLTGETVVCW